jgi:hypothetical protein
MRKTALYLLISLTAGSAFAQGTFSGDLQMNMNFYQKDSLIRASDNPLYDNALSGSDAWLSLRYAINGFTFFARADGFANSNLKGLVTTSTDFGIGAWNVTKELDELTISVGSIYDQIGSGILFRTYEDRGLLIDNALMGFELKYKFGKNVNAKGFVGQIKNNNIDNQMVNNVRFAPVVKGINFEGDFDLGKVHITPGIGALNRTIDGNSMNSIVSEINTLPIKDRFDPRYNMYAFTGYNNLTYKTFSWYIEGAYKTHEAIRLANVAGTPLADKAGNIVFTTFNYGKKGYAINLTGKRTEDFEMRTSPNETILQGMLNWQPIVAVLRPQRLISRYQPPSQNISEQAMTASVTLSPNDVTTINGTYTVSDNLVGEKIYREGFGEIIYQGLDNWILEGGVQYMEYNMNILQSRTEAKYPIFMSFTPLVEVTYKLNDTKSLRLEMQYMDAKYDYGSWAFALLEYNVAPKWSVTVSDMYNINPNTTAYNIPAGYVPLKNHYYNFFVAHTRGSNRFTLAYVKQVDGINCSGGVCRYEPAFSGVKATITSSF